MSAREALERQHPGLRSTDYRVVSPYDPKYNCIAFGACRKDGWWEPDPMREYFWPDGIPRGYATGAIKAVYEKLGYRECRSPDFEPGFQKVAIYYKPEPIPRWHVATQLPSGRWASKLGKNVDIEHELAALVDSYGEVAVVLKRRRPWHCWRVHVEADLIEELAW